MIKIKLFFSHCTKCDNNIILLKVANVNNIAFGQDDRCDPKQEFCF